MHIEPATLDLHHFTLRRRGYDADEVNAVMRRVADSLRNYEQQIASLEEQVANSDPTGKAEEIVAAAERTNARLMEEATATAREVLSEAGRDATTIGQESRETADAHIQVALVEVTTMLTTAREKATAMEKTARATQLQANTVLEVATNNADALRRETDGILASAINEARSIRTAATEQSKQQRDDVSLLFDGALAEVALVDTAAKQLTDEMLTAARAESAELLAESRREAGALVTAAVREARDLRSRVKAEAGDLQAHNQARADEVLSTAHHEMAEIRATARAETTTTISTARAEAEEELRRGKADAAARLATAQAHSERLMDEARGQADQVVAHARQEEIALTQRIGELRRSVVEIERELHRMADVALDHTHLVHRMLTAGDEPDRPAAQAPADLGTSPTTADMTLTIDMTDEAEMTLEGLKATATNPFATPDGSGRPPAARGTVDPAALPGFAPPRMHRISGDDARTGRSLNEAIAASRLQ